MGWRNILYRLGSGAEAHFDAMKIRLRQRTGTFGPIHIQPFITYSAQDEILVRGRVLENRQIAHAEADDLWDNLLNMYKRFNSNEIAGAKLSVSVNGAAYEMETDEDGYFEAWIRPRVPLAVEELWHHPAITLMDAPVPFTPPVVSHASIMTPPVTAQFGVISDIDDTILKTNAQSLLKSAYLTFLNNARTRLPFEGVASFYKALQKGLTGHNFNPIFYVSSSPWNLYDLLVDFMELNGIPKGAVCLGDWGFSNDKFFSMGHMAHKTKVITDILNRYPHLPFILIGDSGQKDPEIYAEIVRQFPGRILAIYIRDVTIDERDMAVKKITEGLAAGNVDLILASTSLAAAEHAGSKGFIHSASLDLMRMENKAAPKSNPEAEALIDEEIRSKKS